jgi:hypothetical protein
MGTTYVGNYTQSPYQTQWNSMYPGQPLPTPDTQPQMFSNSSIPEQVTYDYNPYDFDCTAYVACPKGLIDYQCQWDHSCYIRLL